MNSTKKHLLPFFGSLAESFPKTGSDGLMKEVWIPAFKAAVNEQRSKIGVQFVTQRKIRVYNELKKFAEKEFHGYIETEPFPDLLIDFKTKLDQILFVNEWNPLTIPGNGNSQDNSVDGQIGRASNIGVVGTSMTNRFLENAEKYQEFH
jgi:hypothetical protein